MADEVKCRDCQQWPREDGAKGPWRMCRKWFRLMREDWSCKEGQPISQTERVDMESAPTK